MNPDRNNYLVRWNISYGVNSLPIQELTDKTHEIIWNYLTTEEYID